MNKIALGTVQFGMEYGISNKFGKVSAEEIKSIFQIAYNNRIGLLDTAINYNDSEKYIGEFNKYQFDIVTKIPEIPKEINNVCHWALCQFESSLKRLNSTQILGVLLHRPEDLLGPNGIDLYRALRILQDTGKVRKIGISINSFNEVPEITKKYRLDIIQAPFNVIDRRLYSSGLLKSLKDNNFEIHTRSTFLQGLLLMDKSERPFKFSKWKNIWDIWSDWLYINSISGIHGAIKFPLSFPEIDKIIVGVQNSHQLKDILNAVKDNFSIDFPSIQCNDDDLINPSKWVHY